MQEIHSMKNEGYKDFQIAKHMNISSKTVKRLLAVNPDYMCVDGTQIHERSRILDPYRVQIEGFMERGFQPSQIRLMLEDMFPDINIKRSTLNDYCLNLRKELYDVAESSAEEAPVIGENSILTPFLDKIKSMLAEDKPVTSILFELNSNGYTGSYSLLQQTCFKLRPKTYRTKKAVCKIKRKELITAIWSGKSNLTQQDAEHIKCAFPVLDEISRIISEFRFSYSKKDVEAIQQWCANYEQCQFPAICSFINGINADIDAFYNSIKYEYSNGLLEGFVNKLKTVKRSMFGRASYRLLRAKMLLCSNL